MRTQRSWIDFQVPPKQEPRWVVWASFLFFLASIGLVWWLAVHLPLLPVHKIWPAGWQWQVW
jgi:hypothetical protein